VDNDYIAIICPCCGEMVEIPRELDKDGRKDILLEYGWEHHNGKWHCEMCSGWEE
jgi:hypothetical protein